MGKFYLPICSETAGALSPNCFGWQPLFRHAAAALDLARRISWQFFLWLDRYLAYLSSAKGLDTEHANARSDYQCLCTARFGLIPLKVARIGRVDSLTRPSLKKND